MLKQYCIRTVFYFNKNITLRSNGRSEKDFDFCVSFHMPLITAIRWVKKLKNTFFSAFWWPSKIVVACSSGGVASKNYKTQKFCIFDFALPSGHEILKILKNNSFFHPKPPQSQPNIFGPSVPPGANSFPYGQTYTKNTNISCQEVCKCERDNVELTGYDG